jgi:hypothetical protein
MPTIPPILLGSTISGLNINTIALEIPIAVLPSVVGMYTSTSRRKVEVGRRHIGHFRTVRASGTVANPLVNELIIGTGYKDRWMDRSGDRVAIPRFLSKPQASCCLKPGLRHSVPATPRNDLVAVLQYASQNPDSCSKNNPCSNCYGWTSPSADTCKTRKA